MVVRILFTLITVTIALTCLLIFEAYNKDPRSYGGKKPLFAMVIGIGALLSNLPFWFMVNK